MAIYPSSEQIQALLASTEDGPVVMVNLLKFKPVADAAPGREPGLSGEAVYRQYVDAMVPFVESKGGRVIWSGRMISQVIGTGGEQFQMIALMQYPSRQVFVEIAMDPYVAQIGELRAAGLEMQWLLATTTRE